MAKVGDESKRENDYEPEEELIECPECKGLGYNYWLYRVQKPCSLCDGAGKIKPEDIPF